ncbi:MAG TPA: nucleotidyl transferase AbiEii/AbiGii toxin family protein [Euryarchaeota archaeon]|nr:nucleotidyl transferase AbiEii/AbiGii toxin family protein [Euryarchaeota archaeon]
MMMKGELTRIADIKKLSMENAEKDYILDLLLFQTYSGFGDMLILKGGTSLYKLYSLNRFSEDLDFTLNRRKFDGKTFLKQLTRSLALVGVEGTVKSIDEFKNETNIRLGFRGPLYSGKKESLCFVALNVSQREKVLMDAKKELVVPASKEIPSFQVFVMDEREIAAEKVRAIMTRNKARDIYDLWFLLKRGTKPEIDMINRKLKFYDMKYSSKKFVKAINEKRKFWNTDLRGLMIGDLQDFEKIRSELLTALRGTQ